MVPRGGHSGAAASGSGKQSREEGMPPILAASNSGVNLTKLFAMIKKLEGKAGRKGSG